MEYIEEDKKMKDTLCSWIGRINILKMGLCQTEKLLYSKANNQQNEETTYTNGRKYLQAIYQTRD
jgi:hypothetical protein